MLGRFPDNLMAVRSPQCLGLLSLELTASYLEVNSSDPLEAGDLCATPFSRH